MDAPRRTGYDVVVVGAGVIGLASAWRAAQRGLSVLVVERDEPGAGAAGGAAGMLAPVTEAEFGEESLLQLNLASAEMWPDFAAELAERTGLDTGYRGARRPGGGRGPPPAPARPARGGPPRTATTGRGCAASTAFSSRSAWRSSGSAAATR